MMVCVCVLDTGVSQNANLPARLFRREWEIALCGAGWGGPDFPLLAPRAAPGWLRGKGVRDAQLTRRRRRRLFVSKKGVIRRCQTNCLLLNREKVLIIFL